MKKINLIIIVIFITKITFSQVGIGTVIPDSNSILDIKSSSKGVLFPRLTRWVSIFNPLDSELQESPNQKQ